MVRCVLLSFLVAGCILIVNSFLIPGSIAGTAYQEITNESEVRIILRAKLIMYG